jgi:hypothetical protein
MVESVKLPLMKTQFEKKLLRDLERKTGYEADAAILTASEEELLGALASLGEKGFEHLVKEMEPKIRVALELRRKG